ncbi:MAG: SRPBCC family protein [Actinomycetota bacterium]|nr:SRPBCC family protein [Actinomycetota bacterium]
MELTNVFVIDRPIEETWTILNDLEFIAPCMPGAQLTEIEGDEYRGQVKIKVGPITAAYAGKARFVEQDATNRVAKLKAEGRDPRQGNANAMVTASMVTAGADATTVTIHTDLALSGKIASFGRGAIEDVSKKLLGQFTDNLRDKLAEGASPAAAVAPATYSTEAASAGSDGSSPQADAAAPATPTIRKIDAPEAKPVDILSVAPDSLTKKVLPVLGALVGLLVLRMLFRGRGSAD